MGKEIIGKRHPVTAIYRFYGREIFLKSNNNEYPEQLINQVKARGGTVEQAGGWYKLDIMGSHELVKLGDKEINSKETPMEEIEDILSNFFNNTLKAQGFKTEVKNI